MPHTPTHRPQYKHTITLTILLLSLILSLAPTTPASAKTPAHRQSYPTQAITDYVFACMISNGQNQVMLQRCSCSFDNIADSLTYKEFSEAETILRMQQVSGEKSALFRETEVSKRILDLFLNAQTIAELRCF